MRLNFTRWMLDVYRCLQIASQAKVVPGVVCRQTVKGPSFIPISHRVLIIIVINRHLSRTFFFNNIFFFSNASICVGLKNEKTPNCFDLTSTHLFSLFHLTHAVTNQHLMHLRLMRTKFENPIPALLKKCIWKMSRFLICFIFISSSSREASTKAFQLSPIETPDCGSSENKIKITF